MFIFKLPSTAAPLGIRVAVEEDIAELKGAGFLEFASALPFLNHCPCALLC